MASHIATLLVGLTVSIVISRVGVEELGRWRLAQAIVTYALVGSDAGLTLLAIREVARRPLEVSRYAGPVLFIRFVLALVAIAVGVLVIAPGSDNEAGWFYVAMFLTVVPAALSLIHVAQGLQRMHAYALVRFVSGALASAVGLGAFVVTHNLVLLVVPVIGIGLIVDVGLAAYLRRTAGIAFHTGTPRLWWELLVRGLPFLVGALAIQLISNADAVIIGTSRGEAELGLYAAAYVLAGQLLFLAGPIASVVYPRLAMLHEQGAGFERAVRDFSGVLGLLVVPVCVGAAIIAPSLIDVIYGREYERSVALLTVLMGMPLIGFYNVAMSQALNAARKHATVARVAVLAAAVNVALNVALVPSVGLIGAAIAAVITEVVAATAYTRVMLATSGLAPLRAYLGTIDAVVVMAVVVLLLRIADVALPLSVLMGFAVYAGVVLLRRPDSLATAYRLIRRQPSAR